MTINPRLGVVVKNPNFSLERIQEIISIKARWIYTKLQSIQNRYSIKEIYEKEGKILYLGKKQTLHIEALDKFYRAHTKDIVLDEIQNISEKMGLRASKISFRKTKRRWGSCNHKNELSFTITLAQLPMNCIRYIIIHELAHILHKNHKREFYETIRIYMPNFKVQEKVLKNYSPSII
ncbi:MAG: DUF45 domain-containing protein [Sulfurospirillum sp.]